MNRKYHYALYSVFYVIRLKFSVSDSIFFFIEINIFLILFNQSQDIFDIKRRKSLQEIYSDWPTLLETMKTKVKNC
jgi:hypothetical protein